MNSVYRQLQNIDVRIIAIVMSCIFSLIVIAANPVPNDDAFSYLRAAELFSIQGLDATLSIYGWYWYSVIIALLNTALPIGLMNMAHLVNMLFYGIMVYAFISLVIEYRATNTVKFFAAVVILFFPTINEMRYFLIRDFAYWAFSLTALVQGIRFYKTGKLIHALGWLLSISAAILFRLEGTALLLATPLAMLLPGQRIFREGLKRFVILISFLLAGAATTLLIFIALKIDIVEVFNFTYRWYLPLLVEYPDTISNAAQNTNLSFHISDQVEYFTGKGMAVLLMGYCYAVLTTLAMTLGPPLCLFLAYGAFTGKFKLTTQTKWSWWIYFGTALAVLFTFVSIMQFLTTRYAVLASLLLLSLIPLGIDELYLQAQKTGKLKSFMIAFRVCVLYFAVDSLASFGYSKNYIEQAIVWTHDNMNEKSSLQTNSFSIAYYSGLVPDYDAIDTDPLENLSSLSQKDYLAIDLPHDDTDTRLALAQTENLIELVRFANNRDDAIIIYRIEH